MTSPVPSRKERQAETRRRLFSAAAQVFAAKGYHGASVSEIAASAGYTTGALYSNFDGKEQLFLELIDRQLASQRVEVDELLALTDPAALREALRARIERLMRGVTESGPVLEPVDDGEALSVVQVQTLTLEFLLYVVRFRPDLHPAIARRYRAAEEQLQRVLARWLELEGRESVIPPEDLVLVQSWLTEGLGLRLLQDPDLIAAERAADLFHTVLLELPTRRPPGTPE